MYSLQRVFCFYLFLSFLICVVICPSVFYCYTIVCEFEIIKKYRPETPRDSLGQMVIASATIGWKQRRTHLVRWSFFMILQAGNTAVLTWSGGHCLGSYRLQTPQDSLGQVVIIQDVICGKHFVTNVNRFSKFSDSWKGLKFEFLISEDSVATCIS